jgi:outer membrane lipoprotein
MGISLQRLDERRALRMGCACQPKRGIALARFSRLFSFFLLLSAVSACAYPISRELREEARPDLTFSMVLKNPDAYIGSVVIWGGRIIEVHNHPGKTDVLVLETALEFGEKPEPAEYSRGRFIAQVSGFLDPAIYSPGRMITMAGEVTGKETKPLGDLKYTYPVIKGRQIHLWRVQPVYVYPPDYGWWSRGWWGPYWPYDHWDD